MCFLSIERDVVLFGWLRCSCFDCLLIVLQLFRSYSYFVGCFKFGLVWFCCVVLLFAVGLGLGSGVLV